MKLKKVIGFFMVVLAAFLLFSGLNCYQAKAEDGLPAIQFAGVDHSPLVDGDSESLVLTTDYAGQVQYQVLLKKDGTDNLTDVSNGYLSAVDGGKPFIFSFPEKFKAGEYTAVVRVKRAGTSVDYDSYYTINLNCVERDDNNRVYSDGNIDIDKESCKTGEKIKVNGIKNISGMQGPYNYKLYYYNCSSGNWGTGSQYYGQGSIEFAPVKPGIYVLDLWAMSSNSTLLPSLKDNPGLYEAAALKLVTVTGDDLSLVSRKALFNATSKSMDIKSCEEKSNMNFKVDLSGFPEEASANMAIIESMLKNITISTDSKSVCDASGLAGKAQADMNIGIAGTDTPISMWSDVDFSGNNAKEKVIFTIPPMLSMLTPELSGKQYLVLDPLSINNSALNGQQIDYTKMMALLKGYVPKFKTLIQGYLTEYNPPVDFVTDKGTMEITDGSGNKLNVHCYGVKLDNDSLNDLIKYSVEYFIQNKDGIDFIKEYLLSSIDAASIPDKDTVKQGIEKSFSDFQSNPQEFLKEFNKIMDSLKSAEIIGKDGINADYYVDSNGYIVGDKGSANIVIDISKIISAFSNMQTDAKTVDDTAKGVITINVDFDSKTFNINKDIKIDVPQVNAKNSVDYMKLITDMTPKTGK